MNYQLIVTLSIEKQGVYRLVMFIFVSVELKTILYRCVYRIVPFSYIGLKIRSSIIYTQKEPDFAPFYYYKYYNY